MKKFLLFTFPVLIVILACNLGAPTQSPLNLATLQAQATEQSDASDPHSAPLTPDLLATFLASTPATAVSPLPPLLTPTSAAIPTFTQTPNAASTSIPFPSASDGLTGHIVFTCQIYKVQASNQVCIINADGTGFRRLTTDSSRQHYYPSLSPDGASVVYAAFREENVYEIYEMKLSDGTVRQLTNREGVLNAPEISPDGAAITFMRWTANSNQYQIWLMERDGDNPHNIPRITGWDPTWSPDGKQILFASDVNGSTQLYVVNANGKNLHQVGSLPAIRGRSDWSPDGQSIVTYSGEPWHREVYLMNADGSNVRQLSPAGGNAQGPAFSPDGQWVVFTAYYDHYGDDHGCEIYVVRVDGTDLRRLTDNDYCDYQPRWGP
jgi:Tol biopolymer transport system component